MSTTRIVGGDLKVTVISGVDRNEIGGVREISWEEPTETADVSAAGDNHMRIKPVISAITGSLTVVADNSAAANQSQLAPRTLLTINVRPEGDTAGNTEYTFNCYVSIARTVPYADVSTVTYALKMDGSVTTSTIA